MKNQDIYLTSNSAKRMIARVVFKGDKFSISKDVSFSDMPIIELVLVREAVNGIKHEELFAHVSYETIHTNKGYLNIKGESFSLKTVEKLKNETERQIKAKFNL